MISSQLLIVSAFIATDVSSITLTATSSPAKAVLGQNRFELLCSYQLQTGEQFISMTLYRKRSSENTFSKIVSFPGPSLGPNASYLSGSGNLENRTIAIKPTGQSQTANLVYNDIQCDDKADYTWEATCYNGETFTLSKEFTFVIQVNNRFENDKELVYQPNINIAETDQIVFTCKGDVGNEPTGQLMWFYYLNNDTTVAIDVSSSAESQSPEYNPSTCSNSRQSTLRLTMTKDFNNIMVRCTVAQFNFNQFGDGYIQTTNIPVSSTGSLFTMSSHRVDPTNPSQAKLWMNCTAASITDVHTLFVIKIVRESSSPPKSWEVIATVTNRGVVISTYLPSYWQAAQVSGSIYPVTGGDHPVTDSYLNVGVDASSLTSSDARTYRCELKYLTSSSLQDESTAQNSSLAITVFDVHCDDTSAGCNVLFDMCHTPAYTDWMKTNCRKSCGYCYSNVAPIVG